MSKEDIKRENKRIKKNTDKHNLAHKKECSFCNWKGRLVALLDFGKQIYPMPSKQEQERFIKLTNHKPLFIELKGGNKRNAYKQKSF